LRDVKSRSRFFVAGPPSCEFAADCRTNNKCPDIETFSARERAKLPIYEAKIMKVPTSS
jgi:hypothetical protein